MRLKGNGLEAFRRIWENQAAFDAGHTLPHNILAYCCGGGMSVIKLGYMFIEFGEAGLWNGITYFKTDSGAGGPVGGFKSKRPELVAPTFLRLAKEGFITGVAPLVWFDLEMLRESLRFDQSAINAHNAHWDIAVTRLRDGKTKLLNAKKVYPNAAAAVVASSAVPGMSAPQYVGGTWYVDAVCGDVRRLLTFLEQHPEIDTVIIFQSRPHPKHLSRLEKMLWPPISRSILWWRGFERHIRDGMAGMDQAFANSVAALEMRQSEVVYARLAPTPDDTPVSALTTNLQLLQKAGEEAGQFVQQCLAEAKPIRQV